MSRNARIDAINEISVVSFVLDDLRLFLDTHPCNSEALADYNKHAAHRKELVESYVDKYGPLAFYQKNNDCNDWLWVQYPWPWEGEC